MKTKIIRGQKCRLILDGFGTIGDWIVSREGFYKPYRLDKRVDISEHARRHGQGDVYRPIKPKPTKAKSRKKEVRCFVHKRIFDRDDNAYFQEIVVDGWSSTFCPKSNWRRNYVECTITIRKTKEKP